mmetsp:Transcript_137/g.213  ORF Transcript_137/g.213 Transcript_137/m.213 type:complete len:210 (-) Transcript_137:1664-2293(-)
MNAPGGDRIVQRYAANPVLLQDRCKFDCRSYVFVKSFVPFCAYLHNYYYARVCEKPFNLHPEGLDDPGIHQTVSAYREHKDGETKRRIKRYGRKKLLSSLPDGVGPIWEAELECKLLSMVSELFQGVSRRIGTWPKSRAVYGVDWIPVFEGSNSILPKLIEVNYCPDFNGLISVAEYPEKKFFEDMFGALYTEGFAAKDCTKERLHKLH